MKNNENKTNISKNESEDSEFFEDSYYQKDVMIEYPFYLNNPQESQMSSSQSKSQFTTSMKNPIHAARTGKSKDPSLSNIFLNDEQNKRVSAPLNFQNSATSNLGYSEKGKITILTH